MAKGKCALLVIDMLRDFIEPDGALSIGPSGEAIVPAIKGEIAAARERGEPVIYVCDRHRPDDAEFADWPPHCVAGTEGAEVVDELAPREDDIVVPKRRFSGFSGTDLELTLRELGAETITLVGCCTNICILYTAADARMAGFKVRVPKECVATFDEDTQQFALEELERTLGAEVC
ncbi:MAG: cysteine hydrolase family protein [Armatimonadota bacterium]